MNISQHIQNLISSFKEDEVFDDLIKALSGNDMLSEELKTVNIIRARYFRTRKAEQRKSKSESEIDLAYNQINAAIEDLLEDIGDLNYEPDPKADIIPAEDIPETESDAEKDFWSGAKEFMEELRQKNEELKKSGSEVRVKPSSNHPNAADMFTD